MSAPRRPGGLTGGPLAASLLVHAAALLLLWWGGPRLRHDTPLQIRMVRLAGGGRNLPGWVSEDMRPDALPAEETPAAAPEAPRRETPPPVVARTPAPARAEPRRTPAEPESPRRESERATLPDGRAGGRRDTGAGPRGPGGSRTGATADDPDLAGMGQYLVRVENAVQRVFRYPAKATGRRAVFHFFVDRDGRIRELEQVLESGLPGLDLSGRSAITRAVLPPLPPAFPYDQIGVTFTFVDE